MNPKVLIIEDDQVVRSVVRNIFVGNAWDVVEAENGDTALELVSSEDVRLVILDLNMPVLDGYAFLDCLAESGSLKTVPVVLLTSLSLNTTDKTRFKGRVALMIEKQSGLEGMHKQLETVARAFRSA